MNSEGSSSTDRQRVMAVTDPDHSRNRRRRKVGLVQTAVFTSTDPSSFALIGGKNVTNASASVITVGFVARARTITGQNDELTGRE